MGIVVALPIAAAIAILDRRKIEEFLFGAIGIIILLIFISGFFGNTLPGVYTGVILGGISLLYCVIIFFRNRVRFKESVFTQGFGGLTICVFMAAVVCFGMRDLGGSSDLYRVYAPQIINMYMNNNLGVGNGSFVLLYNAPVCGAWCYFCNKLWFCYSDGMIMWARYIYIISAFAPLYSLIGKSEWKKNLLLSFIIMNLPYVIHPTLCYLNDVTLGCTAVYGTMMTIKLYRDRDRYNDIGYLAVCCWGMIGTCMMKRLGPVFAYGMVSLSATYTVERIKKGEKAGFIRKVFPLIILFLSLSMVFAFNIFRQKNYSNDLFYTYFPIMAFVLLVIMGIAWYGIFCMIRKEWYLITVCTVLVVSFLGYYLLLKLGAHYSDLNVAQEVISGFTIEWFNELAFDNGINIPDPLFMVMFLLIMFIISYFIKRGQIDSLSTPGDIGVTSGLVFLGGILVATVVLCTYLQNELLSKVHTYRYLRPAILVMIVVMIYELLCIKNKYSTNIVVIMTIFLILLFPPNNIVAKLIPEEGEKRWNVFRDMYADAGIELALGEKVIYVGKDHYTMYAAFPAWAVWYTPEDDTPEELKSWVLNYGSDYLIIDDCDHNFADTYQDMFVGGISEIKENAIYDVVVEDENVRFVCRN